MDRRQLLRTGAAALSAAAFPLGWVAAADKPRRKLLVFTRSQGFEHSCVKRGKNNEPSHVERIMVELGKQHGFDVTCTKDGRVFIPEELAKYDAFLFETTGNLDKEGGDKNPPMPPDGKANLLKAVASGKGFVGCHCASDTFHSKGPKWENQPQEQIDPYLQMLGGEFIQHGAQQKATLRLTDPSFPGAKGLQDFNVLEEWYSLKNFAPDLHVIQVEQTQGAKGFEYDRPDFPCTWARRHEKGRVFFTSMGHREDVWSNPKFQELLLGGLAFAFANVDPDLTPNLSQAAPQASVLPKPPAPQKKPQ
jgi:type 1 glutamine amidotransferase